MTKREKNKLMAERLDKAAIRYYNRSIRIADGDAELVEMACVDLSDMQRIASYLRRNMVGHAARVLYNMDSDPIDSIPRSVYNHICYGE